MKLEFSRQIFDKKLKYKISSKSVQCEPSCSVRTDTQTDGRTDMTKLIIAFRKSRTRLKEARRLLKSDHVFNVFYAFKNTVGILRSF